MDPGGAGEQSLLLGLDLGISTLKAALFTAQGRLLHLTSDEYLIMPEGDRVEVDPEIYWAPMARAIRRLLDGWGGPAERIAAVAVSSHGETVYPMAADGRPARPALVWMDNRSAAEAEELTQLVGTREVQQITGQGHIGPIWPVTKLRWLARHEPESVRRTACYLLPADYILLRLCGSFVGDFTLWSSSLVLDIRSKTWSAPLLDFSCIKAEQLPPLHPAGTAVGHISAACAAETGLSPSTRVVTGALDQVCAALGAGNIEPGIVTESTGSVLALLATIPHPIFDTATRVPCHIHALPDTYCLLPWNTTGGLTLKWFKDRFAPDCMAEHAAGGPDAYDLLSAEAAEVAPGSDGLVMLPHLDGAFFPEYDPLARGVFFGFGLGHKRGHFVRAIMEAVAYMARRDLEVIRHFGVDVREVRVLGGGAKSRLWTQIKADVLDVPIVLPDQDQAAALGAALLAAVGAGIYPDIPAAVAAMTRNADRLLPNPANRKVYDMAFELYVRLYDTVQPLFESSAAIQKLQAPR